MNLLTIRRALQRIPSSFIGFVLVVAFSSPQVRSVNYAFAPASDCQNNSGTFPIVLITHFDTYTAETGGNCQYGTNWGTQTPWPFISAAAVSVPFLNRGPGTESGPLNANNCGVCYELIGPIGSVRVIVAEGSGDESDSGFHPHFDLGGGTDQYTGPYPLLVNASRGIGQFYVNARLVACDFTGVVKFSCILCDPSAMFFVPFNHIFGLSSIEMKEGSASFTPVVRDQYNTFSRHAANGNSFVLPITLRITSHYGDVVTCNVTSQPSTGTIYDCSGQFSTFPPDPAPCIQPNGCCSAPDLWKLVYDDSLKWYWALVAGTADFTSTAAAHSGTYGILMTIQPYGDVHLSSESIPPRLDQYSSLQFWAKADAASSSVSVHFYGSDTGGVFEIPIPQISTTWTLITVDLTAAKASNTLGTYFYQFGWLNNDRSATIVLYIDEIRFIDDPNAPSLAQCAPATTPPLFDPCQSSSSPPPPGSRPPSASTPPSSLPPGSQPPGSLPPNSPPPISTPPSSPTTSTTPGPDSISPIQAPAPISVFPTPSITPSQVAVAGSPSSAALGTSSSVPAVVSSVPEGVPSVSTPSNKVSTTVSPSVAVGGIPTPEMTSEGWSLVMREIVLLSMLS